MSPSGVAPRVQATRVLAAVLHRGRSLKAELASALPALDDPRDRALTEAICFSALRARARFDAALRRWMPKPPGKHDAELHALLLGGLAQLQALELPAHAALSATVEAARALGKPHQAGLVNALLRRAQREGVAEVDASLAWPQWLRQRVTRDWPDQAHDIFAASLAPAPLWLRVNRARVSRADYLAQLQAAGIQAEAHAVLAEAIGLQASVPVASLPGFAQGLVSVQDGSAQQVADAVAPAAHARVLDACAAPGGKSAHLLERDPSLQLLALDIDPRRLARVRETLARVGARAQVVAGDAGEPAAWWDGAPFDAVLLDAPCSATGIVRRQPDVLIHRREQDLSQLTLTQARLLDAAWAMLKPGGTLVYTTCSILKDENARQIDGFLARQPQAQVLPLDQAYGHASGAGRQRLPGEDGMDGFFYARLRKAG
ncbi:16S rRNA (cytosine(967)-C(5))-methyltransferase RsmB [Pseudoxanthomonas composti]|uniref:16S rRNA (cytosine(967)-C(5))-methyltransferase n=1 Tax=Pseudoxanthomonas composti TaxID=2137479 RepID=A0A4Q1JU49_9GAMM|nr:16S rRNA (cytosine(967)-C(5))-methyltransferase RsmB [Pseudoxanthomonas composti]RXR01988.1 16S rRNA (cytosine(967)-C(5))-methyltransferase RsmB [Pseudoxanthomonas composti]